MEPPKPPALVRDPRAPQVRWDLYL